MGRRAVEILLLIGTQLLAAGCFLDMGSAIPCQRDGECPAGERCDRVILRCVSLEEGEEPAPGSTRTGSVPSSDAPTGTEGEGPVTGSGESTIPTTEFCEPGDLSCCDPLFDDACVEPCDALVEDCPDAPCRQGQILIPGVDEADQGVEEGAELPAFDYCIDAWEASRADASDTSEGEDDEAPPRSVPGVLPWSGISFEEAEAACASAEKRLCTSSEYRRACAGLSGNFFPYGRTPDRFSCNGAAYAGVDGSSPPERTYPTGSEPRCVSEDGVFDMVGNLSSWVQGGRLAGGHFGRLPPNLRCDRFVMPSEEPEPETRGFRCCSEPRQ